jgi:Activator of Hsp90 ATPase homolog 1-like protein
MTEVTPATRSIVVERIMPHPPQKIWRALTESSLIAEWLMQNDFTARMGATFSFRAKPMGNWNGSTHGALGFPHAERVRLHDDVRRLADRPRTTATSGFEVRRHSRSGYFSTLNTRSAPLICPASVRIVQ